MEELVNEQESVYLVEHLLKKSKQLGATSAEIALSNSSGLTVTARLGELETVEFTRDRSIGLTVYIGTCKGSASTSDLRSESLEETLNAALHLAKLAQSDPDAGLADKAEMANAYPSLDLYHPWHISTEDLIELAKDCEESARCFDKRITNSEGATLTSARSFQLYANSHGFTGYYSKSKQIAACTVIAEYQGTMERDGEYAISRQAEHLKSMEEIGEGAAKRAIAKLESKKLPTQKAPVLFDARIASSLIQHFIAAISGGQLFRKSSFLLDTLGQLIFPAWMQIDERPLIPLALGSRPFDGDGVRVKNKDIIKNGILESYILSAYSARKLKLPNTGNAGGISNVFVSSNLKNDENILNVMDKGFLVTSLMGQGINLVTGDYSRGASGFWVENGKIQFPVHEMTIAGNLKDMFSQIVAVGQDVDKRQVIQTGSILIEKMMLAGQ